MSGHQPNLGFKLFSTPFSRNDGSNSNFNWTQINPELEQQGHQTYQNGNLVRPNTRSGYDNHFAIPVPRLAYQEECRETHMDIEEMPGRWTGELGMTDYGNQEQQDKEVAKSLVDFGQQEHMNILKSISTVHNRERDSTPLNSSRAPGILPSNQKGRAVGSPPPPPSRPVTVCGGSPLHSSFRSQEHGYWNSRFLHSIQPMAESHSFSPPNNSGFRAEGCPSSLSPRYSMLPQQGNHTLVPVETNPQPKSLEWILLRDASKGLQIFGSEGGMSMDGGVGDPFKRLNVKFPMSPLDSSFPPIKRYLSPKYAESLNSPREAFSPEFHVLLACGQCASISIDLIFDNLDDVYKVNEGVFGEVYAGYFNNGLDESVYKIVPIEGTGKVNNEKQKRYEEIETEIRVSQRLNVLWNKGGRNYTEGFCHLFWARLLRGRYPKVLVKAWNDWNVKNKSDNDLPDFGANQLYVALEYQHCGFDAESFLFQSAEQSHSVLFQVAFALAAAECALRFEHRDLHWGNIIVSKTNERYVFFRVDGVNYKFPSNGIKSTIIDFTMARCDGEGREVIFDDLKNDEVQFSGQLDYQFEIYRQMRTENKNNWIEFHPKTNIFWLHYLCDKFLTKANYDNKSSQIHQIYVTHLQSFFNHILIYESCATFVKMQRQYVVSLMGLEDH